MNRQTKPVLEKYLAPFAQTAQAGFSLVELIAGMVIIALLSTAGWMSASVLFRSAETARNRDTAVNLLQKSQEELQRNSRSFFDDLENCQFPGSSLPGLNCDFSITQNTFPGFVRTLTVSKEQGSSELKRALLTVSWEEFGRSKVMSSVMLLSRPPSPLPGNIIGLIRSRTGTPAVIQGARIRVAYQSSTQTVSTSSSGQLSSNGANFDFRDAVSGQFILPVGSWVLTVSHNQYLPYTHPDPIVIGSNQEVFVDIALEPRPTDATISGQVVLRANGQAVPSFKNAFVNLYENGQLANNVQSSARYSGARQFTFRVAFEDALSRCFTLNSTDAFKAGYAYRVGSAGAPSCSYNYNPDGWSSAVMMGNGSLMCGNPWNGSAAQGGHDPDQICVSSGDAQTVNIFVEPVPEVIISGSVQDDKGRGIANATVFARWPKRRQADWIKTARTDSNGRYNFSVPAVQDMFPDGSPSNYHLQVWAEGEVQITNCCDQVSGVTRKSQTEYVGPLKVGYPVPVVPVLKITGTDSSCGDSQGKISDARSLSPLSDARVRMVSQSENSGPAGDYLFDCPSTGYRLPVGKSIVRVDKSGFYTFESDGNNWYASQPDINIIANQMANYDAKLWPIGRGTIIGTVRDKGTKNPIAGARVTLDVYSGSDGSATTDSSGNFRFDQVPETWPAASLPVNSSYFNYQKRSHSISSTHSSGIYMPAQATVNQLNAGQTLRVDLEMATQGAL